MKNILIVEDDTKLRRLFSTNLQVRGYHVLLADDLNTARQNITDYDLNLIILDLLLGEENGLDLARELAQNDHFQRIPIIISSASLLDIRRSEDYPNICHRMLKPFDIRLLVDTVSEVV